MDLIPMIFSTPCEYHRGQEDDCYDNCEYGEPVHNVIEGAASTFGQQRSYLFRNLVCFIRSSVLLECHSAVNGPNVHTSRQWLQIPDCG